MMSKVCAPAPAATKSVSRVKSGLGAIKAAPTVRASRRSVAVRAESTAFDNYKFSPIREAQVSREMSSRCVLRIVQPVASPIGPSS